MVRDWMMCLYSSLLHSAETCYIRTRVLTQSSCLPKLSCVILGAREQYRSFAALMLIRSRSTTIDQLMDSVVSQILSPLIIGRNEMNFKRNYLAVEKRSSDFCF